MKLFLQIFRLAVIVSTASCVVACSDDAKNHVKKAEDRAEQALDEATGAARSERDAYRRQLETRIDALNAKIQTTKQKTEKLSGKAKDDMQARLAKLEEKRDELNKKMGELQDKGSNAWAAAKSGIDKAVDDLESTYEDIKESFE